MRKFEPALRCPRRGFKPSPVASICQKYALRRWFDSLFAGGLCHNAVLALIKSLDESNFFASSQPLGTPIALRSYVLRNWDTAIFEISVIDHGEWRH
jgi:hypothetical protein